MKRRVLKGKWVVANLPRGGVVCGRVEKRERKYGSYDVLTLSTGHTVVTGDVINTFSDELVAHHYAHLCRQTRA